MLLLNSVGTHFMEGLSVYIIARQLVQFK